MAAGAVAPQLPVTCVCPNLFSINGTHMPWDIEFHALWPKMIDRCSCAQVENKHIVFRFFNRWYGEAAASGLVGYGVHGGVGGRVRYMNDVDFSWTPLPQQMVAKTHMTHMGLLTVCQDDSFPNWTLHALASAAPPSSSGGGGGC